MKSHDLAGLLKARHLVSAFCAMLLQKVYCIAAFVQLPCIM